MKLGTILNKSMSYCTYRERSVAEVDKYLNKFDINIEEKKFIIDCLVKEKFINNHRYIQEYIASKFKINHWGKIRIASNLKKHNLDPDEINESLELIDKVEYINTLKSILLKKRGSLIDDNIGLLKAKLTRYALQKGFEIELINQQIEKLLDK